MRGRSLFATAILLAFLAAAPGAARAQTWQLTWADEFDGPANARPDAAKWNYDLGGRGWGNNELQTYTDRAQNAFLDGNGNLVIKAIKETLTGGDGITREYTSARLVTRGKFSRKYGRFEARIKVPFGQGIWPAFWMLGDDIATAGWPACGEIDILENIGREPSTVHGSLHGPGYSGGSPLTGHYNLSGGEKFTDQFHVFAAEWEPAAVRFYVDGNLYLTRTPADVADGRRWVFDHPFHMLLNVAVGGNWPGNPDATTTFPQVMLVDYVRVYADAAAPTSRPIIQSVTFSGKHLTVWGEFFAPGAVILLNGVEQKTRPDGPDPRVLVGKKAGKKVGSGQPARVLVRNPDRTMSDEFTVTRP